MSCKKTNNDSNIASKQSPPNILFIMSDDHTSQAWGLYGGVLKDHVKNNHIKRLASEGMLLTMCFVQIQSVFQVEQQFLQDNTVTENRITLADSLQPQQIILQTH